MPTPSIHISITFEVANCSASGSGHLCFFLSHHLGSLQGWWCLWFQAFLLFLLTRLDLLVLQVNLPSCHLISRKRKNLWLFTVILNRIIWPQLLQWGVLCLNLPLLLPSTNWNMLRMLIVSKLNRIGKLIIQVLCSLIPLEPSRRCQHGFNMSFQLLKPVVQAIRDTKVAPGITSLFSVLNQNAQPSSTTTSMCKRYILRLSRFCNSGEILLRSFTFFGRKPCRRRKWHHILFQPGGESTTLTRELEDTLYLSLMKLAIAKQPGRNAFAIQLS